MPSTATNIRGITHQTRGQAASDGDGVSLQRIIGTHDLSMIDPFLLFDAFGSDDPDQYIGGFPTHPHRGFETVTYMLAGAVRHKDNAGHEGVITPGGVQWMTAGSGISHSEMPEQEDGLLRGFQLWVNLPAKDKMTAPAYQEFAAAEIPQEQHDNHHIRVVAGTTSAGTQGAVTALATKSIYLDVSLKDGASFSQSLPPEHNGFIYMIEGEAVCGPDKTVLLPHVLGILGPGDTVELQAAMGRVVSYLSGEKPYMNLSHATARLS